MGIAHHSRSYRRRSESLFLSFLRGRTHADDLPSAPQSISFDAVLVDPVTSTIYHVEKRPSEQGRSVIVETKTNTDVFGAQWDAKSMVHDYGG